MDGVVDLKELLEKGEAVTIMADTKTSLTDIYDRIDNLQTDSGLDLRTSAILSVDGSGVRVWVHQPEVNPWSFLDAGLLRPA